MRRLLATAVIFSAFLFARGASAQTVFPMQGVGSVQFFNNAGAVCSGCALYTFQAGTTTQTATYNSSVGNVLNSDPVIADSTGRMSAWLTSINYKLQLCLANDGAACASGDILWTSDQVPGNPGASGSSSSPFISASPSPATSGILRLANGDSIGIRNAANNGNWLLGLKGAGNSGAGDILTWPGGSLQLLEIVCPSGGTTVDLLCADNTAHRLKQSGNGGALVQLVNAGADINTSDQVTVTHLGSALPVAQGGTGVTTSTGSGSVVLSTSPNLTTPQINSVTISNVPWMAWSTYTCESLCSTSAVANQPLGLLDTNGGAITIRTFRIAVQNGTPNCTTYPTYVIFDETAGGAVSGASIQLTNSLGPYAVTVNTGVAASHLLDFRKTGGACSTYPGQTALSAMFTMQ
jgi:hypothetical protein